MGRYTNIPLKDSPTGKPYRETVIYPDIPLQFSDIYAYTDEGDRFDILASSYYNDSSLWWVIANANPQFNQGSMFPPLGVQIRIPTDIGAILTRYERLNSGS